MSLLKPQEEGILQLSMVADGQVRKERMLYANNAMRWERTATFLVVYDCSSLLLKTSFDELLFFFYPRQELIAFNFPVFTFVFH